MLLIFVFTWSVHYEKALNSFMTKAVIICRANQWTGFCMITASVVKGLNATKTNEIKPFINSFLANVLIS